MRTTVTLPPRIYRQVKELADREHRSVSSVIVDLTMRGLRDTTPPNIEISPVSGLPVVSLGRRITGRDVAKLLEEDE